MKQNVSPKGVFCALFLVAIATASAAPVNLYTFNDGTATDSVGGQNGTVIDPGAVTATYFTSGLQRSLDLRGNTGQSSNGITEDAFVDLPNGIITAAANSGTSGALSFSVWVTVDTNRNWAEIYAFGTSNGGENSSSGGGTSPYLALIPDTGDAANTSRLTSHSTTGSELSVSAAANAVLSPGTQHHIVGVFDQSGGVPGTLTYYLDNTMVGSGPIATGLTLNNFTNDNNWIGRSQWPDPMFDGLVNELAIYNTALSAAEVGALFAAGPVAIPEPTAGLLSLIGMLVACRRRRG